MTSFHYVTGPLHLAMTPQEDTSGCPCTLTITQVVVLKSDVQNGNLHITLVTRFNGPNGDYAATPNFPYTVTQSFVFDVGNNACALRYTYYDTNSQKEASHSFACDSPDGLHIVPPKHALPPTPANAANDANSQRQACSAPPVPVAQRNSPSWMCFTARNTNDQPQCIYSFVYSLAGKGIQFGGSVAPLEQTQRCLQEPGVDVSFVQWILNPASAR